MTTIDAILIAALLTLLFVAIGAVLLYLREKSHGHRESALYWEARQQIDRVKTLLLGETRYQVTVTDWGPDFTGEDGTLPRWRWVVTDADFDLKDSMGLVPKGDPVPFMLGNSHSRAEAWFSALRWIEWEKNTARVVVP